MIVVRSSSSRTALAALLAAAGCGGKAAPSTMDNAAKAPPARWTPVLGFARVSAPRPALDVELLVPDFHEELRWPLGAMSHPELDPQFEIANVFAEPGIGWIDLCQRGVQNRVISGRNRDELDYLRGWCSALKGDADNACGKLVSLTSSPVLGMPAAVRIDIANIIASSGDIDKADALINKHRIRDIEIYDTLAATYVELGKEPYAYEMNRRALELSPVGERPDVHCRRLVRDIVLGGVSSRTIRFDQLADMATKPKVPDETCVALHREMRCFLGPASECDEYFRHEKIDPRNTFLLDAYRDWPGIGGGTFYEWLDVVAEASLAGDVAGAPELMTIALDSAIKAAPSCAPHLLRAISEAAIATPSADRRAQLQAELDRCKWSEKLPPGSRAAG